MKCNLHFSGKWEILRPIYNQLLLTVVGDERNTWYQKSLIDPNLYFGSNQGLF